MSASKSLYLLNKPSEIISNEDDSDGGEFIDEEREKFLQKVEESAKAIRTINMLTLPIINQMWGEEKFNSLNTDYGSPKGCDIGRVNTPVKSILSTPYFPSKENKPRKTGKKRVSFTPQTKGKNTSPAEQHTPDCGSPALGKKSPYRWSPIKHVQAVGDLSPLKMEKITWTPLRKSKSRRYSSHHVLNMVSTDDSEKSDSLRKSPAPPENKNCVSDASVQSTPTKKTPTRTVLNGLRSPLKTVKTSNQTPLKRVRSPGDVEGPASNKYSASSVSSPMAKSSLYTEVSSERVTVPNKTPLKMTIFNSTSDGDELSSDACPPTMSSTDGSEASAGSSNKSKAEICGDAGSVPCTPKIPESHVRVMKSPVRYSPILLKTYGEQSARIRGSIVSPQRLVNTDCAEGVGIDSSKVLKGVVAYVEVRRGEDDRTGGFRWKLKQLGATLADTLTKKVTHVVFQEGLLSTFRKAKEMKVHLVSAYWVMACDESLSIVPEEKYPIEDLHKYELTDPLKKVIRRPKVMSPDLGSGLDDRRLSLRVKKIQRRSTLAVQSSPMQEKTSDTESLFKKLQNDSLPLVKTNNEVTEVTEEEDDEWDDGFLAMVEAQVREKLRAEQREEAEEDFETRLRKLLGKTEDKDNLAPLAPIFQGLKAKPQEHDNGKRKSRSKTKSQEQMSASSSLMKSWLLANAKAPAGGALKGDVCQTASKKELSASEAADALSDLILKNMIVSSSLSAADPEVLSCSKPSKSDPSNCVLKSPPKVHSQAESSHGSTVLIKTVLPSNDKLVVSHAQKSEPTTKKLTKRNKFTCKGSEASSEMMRNWLIGNKRKLVEGNDKEGCGSVKHSTPVKATSNMSPSVKKSGVGTPRRRSARLTPLKALSPTSKIADLKAVVEENESEFSSREAKSQQQVKVARPVSHEENSVSVLKSLHFG